MDSILIDSLSAQINKNLNFLEDSSSEKSLSRFSSIERLIENKTDVQKVKIKEVFNNLKKIDLFDETWEIYSATALHNFSYSDQDLYKYKEILTEYLRKTLTKKGTDKYMYIEVCVDIEVYPDITIAENDHPSLKFSIEGRDVRNEENKDQIVWDEYLTAFFLSVEKRGDTFTKETREMGTVILPLVLFCYTEEEMLQAFFDFSEEIFSCDISPFTFLPSDLKWMLTLFTFATIENLKTSITFVYKTPFEGLKSIEYSLPIQTVIAVQEKIIGRDEFEITESKMNKFISELEGYFFEKFYIDLSRLKLHVIRAPFGTIMTDDNISHSIKICESDAVYYIMRYLTHLAQEKTK